MAEDDENSPPDGFDQMTREILKRQERYRVNFAGGVHGSRAKTYEELPNDPEVLKWMYLELQNSYTDNQAQLSAYTRGTKWDQGEEALEGFLSHIWNRGIELLGLIGVLTFLLIQFVGGPANVSYIGGIAAIVAFYERGIRPLLQGLDLGP